MIPEVEGTRPWGPSRKRVPECLKGPKTTYTIIAIAENSPREVKRAHFRYIRVYWVHPGPTQEMEVMGPEGKVPPGPPPSVSPAMPGKIKQITERWHKNILLSEVESRRSCWDFLRANSRVAAFRNLKSTHTHPTRTTILTNLQLPIRPVTTWDWVSNYRHPISTIHRKHSPCAALTTVRRRIGPNSRSSRCAQKPQSSLAPVTTVMQYVPTIRRDQNKVKQGGTRHRTPELLVPLECAMNGDRLDWRNLRGAAGRGDYVSMTGLPSLG